MSTFRFTEKSQEALLDAQRSAEEAHHSSVEGLHLLQALVGQEGGIVPLTVRSAGVDPKAVQSRVSTDLQRLPHAYGPTQIAMNDELRRVIRQAEDEASRLKDDLVSTEHLLLGLAG